MIKSVILKTPLAETKARNLRKPPQSVEVLKGKAWSLQLDVCKKAKKPVRQILPRIGANVKEKVYE